MVDGASERGDDGSVVDSASATVRIDEQGRLYLPSQTRKPLGIYGVSATLDLDIDVLRRHGETEQADKEQ